MCNEPWELEPVGEALLASFKRHWDELGKQCVPHAHSVCSGRVTEEGEGGRGDGKGKGRREAGGRARGRNHEQVG